MADGDINLQVRLDNLKAELAKIPGLTEPQIKKMASAANKGFKQLERDAARAAEKTADSFEDAFKSVKPQVEGFGKAFDKLGFGPMANDAKDLAEGLMALGPAGGTALVAAAGVTSLATAAVAAGVGVVALVANTEALAKSVEHVAGIEGLGIDQGKLDRVRDATAAMEALRTIATRAAAAVGVEFGESVHRGTRLLVALGLAGTDALNALLQGGNEVSKAFTLMLDVAFNPLTLAMIGITDAARKLFAALGRDTSVLDSMIEGFKLTTYTGGKVEETFKTLEWAAGDYLGRADELIKVEKARAAAHGEAAASTVEAAAALEELDTAANDRAAAELAALQAIMKAGKALREAQLTSDQKRIEAIEGEIAGLEEARAAVGENAAAVIAADEAIAAKRAEIAEIEAAADRAAAERRAAMHTQMMAQVNAEMNARLDLLEQVAQTVGAVATAYADAHGERLSAIQEERAALRDGYAEMDASERERARAKDVALKKQAKDERAAMKRAFAVSKAAAIAAALIAGAQAAVAMIPGLALAMGPAAAGAPAAAAILAGAATGIQVAAISAQQPTFHRGGSPDEVAATLTRGEAVLSPRGVAAMGGDDGVRALNRGEQPQSGTVVVSLNDRVIDVIQSRMTQRSAPALRAATGAQKPGSRSGYTNG